MPDPAPPPRTTSSRVGARVAPANFAAAALLLLALPACFLAGLVFDGFSPIPFDAAAWKASTPDHSHDSPRLRMVDDLLASHPLTGLTRPEVETLLGPADDTTYFSSADMVYYLGLERSGMTSIDSEWLTIFLDDQGRVTAATLARD